MSEEKKTSKSTGPSRRDFLASTGALAVGASVATGGSAYGAVEKLARDGGPKAVTYSGNPTKWPRYGEAEEQAVLELVRSPNYNPIAQLEKDWREFTGVPHAKAHCNGTAALTSMFFTLNLPPGSEIMVPSYTFFATIVPMRLFGLVPVFVDIDPRTLNLDLEDAKKRLTKNTKAILPVHWIGLPCDMDAINEWANEKGLIVLEDAAHAQGAKLQGKTMGNWSRMAITSYQMSKALPGIEGGMGMYQSREDHDRACAFGHYKVPGVDPDGDYAQYNGTGLGVKFRIHPYSAALVSCQLKGLDERNKAGAKQVRELNDQLLQLPGLYEQTSGRKDMERIHYAWNMLFIDEAEAGAPRDKIIEALKAEGVGAAAIAYTLQHEQPLYRQAEWWHHLPKIPDLPNSTKANQTSLSLPYFTEVVPELVEQYVKAFEKVWAHRKDL